MKNQAQVFSELKTLEQQILYVVDKYLNQYPEVRTSHMICSLLIWKELTDIPLPPMFIHALIDKSKCGKLPKSESVARIMRKLKTEGSIKVTTQEQQDAQELQNIHREFYCSA